MHNPFKNFRDNGKKGDESIVGGRGRGPRREVWRRILALLEGDTENLDHKAATKHPRTDNDSHITESDPTSELSFS